ncbi:MAG TPA: choice-of-anchor R domain-containing protein [Verrucomicrobiae bacterium]|jgi:hypothetical protein
MKTVASFCIFLCTAMTMLAQTNYIAISNLNQSEDNSAGAGGSGQVAVSFTTDTTTNFLLSVSVSLGKFFAPEGTSIGPINLSLYSDAAGSPGGYLATLSGNSYPTNAGIYTYTGLYLLTSNTTYWLVASSPETRGGVGDAFYPWIATYSTSLDSGSTWALGKSKEGYNGGWTILNDGANLYLEFSVTVTPVVTHLSPPLLSIFQPIVLNYTNYGTPFVLQQNSDLATTNWVNVTNAILSGIISNQVVFIVSPTGQQMFYRLNSQ